MDCTDKNECDSDEKKKEIMSWADILGLVGGRV